jgi:uncharacterized protein (TIGR02646 family)
MIRIAKRPLAPEILETKGRPKAEAHCREYDADPEAYRTGTRSFAFDNAIYGHNTVKTALIEDQHGKCCYCEGKPLAMDHGDVEHFRPKGGYVQADGERLRRPGYYWLAYAWTNLLFSCALCNQSRKRSHFPLHDPTARAQHHSHDIGAENPVLVDPCTDEPAEHIFFRAEYAVPVAGSTKGHMTIECLRLNSEPLADERRQRLQELRLIQALADLDGPEAAEARQHLASQMRDTAKYAAMVRRALAGPA